MIRAFTLEINCMATKISGNKPVAKHRNLLLIDEKGLGVLQLNLMVLPLSVDSVILENVGLPVTST